MLLTGVLSKHRNKLAYSVVYKALKQIAYWDACHFLKSTETRCIKAESHSNFCQLLAVSFNHTSCFSASQGSPASLHAVLCKAQSSIPTCSCFDCIAASLHHVPFLNSFFPSYDDTASLDYKYMQHQAYACILISTSLHDQLYLATCTFVDTDRYS